LIAWRVGRSKSKQWLYLFTTLSIPPEEVVALYGKRWNIETAIASPCGGGSPSSRTRHHAPAMVLAASVGGPSTPSRARTGQRLAGMLAEPEFPPKSRRNRSRWNSPPAAGAQGKEQEPIPRPRARGWMFLTGRRG